MFIQNQINSLDNHKDIIAAEIDKANEVRLVIAYIKENGVDIILDKIKSKPTKLLCSLDMGITQLSSIKKLLENNVEVKVYSSNAGTFHPKIWLFGNDNKWKMLIGSANLTRAALIENVEASVLVEGDHIITNALMFFDYLWDKENASAVSMEDISVLEESVMERKSIKNKPYLALEQDDIKKIEELFKYTRNWIDIPKFDSQGISALWRGWYIIPDQGYITDKEIENLILYLPFVRDGILLRASDEKYRKLLTLFVNNSNFQRETLKTSNHQLFIRQAKNYLIKFGWCAHPYKRNGKPDKTSLVLTELGRSVNLCKSLEGVKILYTDYFFNYTYNGLHIVQFTRDLLDRVEHLTLDEFNYFVVHAYGYDELEKITSYIRIYRSMSNPNSFDKKFLAYFKEIKDLTAKNVYGNYVKNIKHTISVIAWCKGFVLDESNFTLRLCDEDK